MWKYEHSGTEFKADKQHVNDVAVIIYLTILTHMQRNESVGERV